VLSGTASDGTVGLEEIKAEGASPSAQDESAVHGGMPHQTHRRRCVGFCAAACGHRARAGAHRAPLLRRRGQLPLRPSRRDTNPAAHRPPSRTLRLAGRAPQRDTAWTSRITRPNTLYRRIARRMVLHKLESLADYLAWRRRNGRDDALYRDILINVTSFFRNPEAYEALKARVVPQISRARWSGTGAGLVSGCSTGEEAYSGWR